MSFHRNKNIKIIFDDNLFKIISQSHYDNIIYLFESNIKSISSVLECYYKVKIKTIQVQIDKSE